MWDTAILVLRGKFLVRSAYIKKEECLKLCKLTSLKKKNKSEKEQNNPKASTR